MTCPKCGKDSTSNNYCVYCGFRFNGVASKYLYPDDDNKNKKITHVGLIPLILSCINFLLIPTAIKYMDFYLKKFKYIGVLASKLDIKSIHIILTLVSLYLIISLLVLLKSYTAYYKRGVTKLRKIALFTLLVGIAAVVIFYVGPYIYDYMDALNL